MEGSQTPQIELPKPVGAGEQPAANEVVAAPEKSANTPTSAPANQAPQPPVIPLVDPGATSPVTPVSPTQSTTNPAIADDVDVIEKEWVQKARAIVQQTKLDPYRQNKELTVFKADYMKKRYGKDIKLTAE